MNIYHIPPGVELVRPGRPALLSTAQGGRVALDPVMVEIWRQAEGHTLQEVVAHLQAAQAGAPPVMPDLAGGELPFSGAIAAALLCLEGAGLLTCERPVRSHRPHRSESAARVSVIVVSYNSRAWLPGCLRSIAAQTLPPVEVIIVDNASGDGSADWVEEFIERPLSPVTGSGDPTGNAPQVRLIHFQQTVSLAQALNRGIAAACQENDVLLLNPDIEMEPDALEQMVAVAHQDPACAAVAAKLKFLWAPAFLNGLGNAVGALSWGTDSALGHLDLGQFDNWDEIPSACFAAALIPRGMFEQVGPIDEGFPMYYEDSEWCYRARLYGYHVHAAPNAVIHHAFSGRVPGEEEAGLSAAKLHRVVYGRLRFVAKLLSWPYQMRFFASYLVEDLARCSLALAHGRWGSIKAYARAWRDYLGALPELRRERRKIQSRRRCSDRVLFRLQRSLPMPLIWRGLPWLTWDQVCCHYLPLMLASQAPYLVGMMDDLWNAIGFPHDMGSVPTGVPVRYSNLSRARSILRSEGMGGLWYHLGRWLQWRLARV